MIFNFNSTDILYVTVFLLGYQDGLAKKYYACCYQIPRKKARNGEH